MAGSNLFNSKSASAQDGKLDKQRKYDDYMEKISRYITDDRLATEANTFLDRSDAYRRKREADEKAALSSRQEEHEQMERMNKASQQAREDDEWIAKILEDQDTKYERQKRALHHLIKDSPELRALKTKLQIAEMNRQRHQQLREKQLLELEEAACNAEFHKAMEEKFLEGERQEQERLHQQQMRTLATKQNLDEQVQYKEMQKRKEAEQVKREHEEMDELIAKFKEEHLVEAQMKISKHAQQREFMLEHLRQHDLMVRKREEDEKEADRLIQEYRVKLEQRLIEKEEKQKEKKERDKRLHAILSTGKVEEARRKEDIENLINDYYFEEAEAQYEKSQEELNIQKERAREDLKAANEHYQMMKEKRLLQEKEEKEEFRKQMMEQLAKEHKLEQLSEQKRRMKIIELKREIDSLWLTKKEAFEEQLKEAKMKYQKEAEEVALREAVIEEERRRLLLEHGKRLAQYLPKGTLKSADELRIVGLQG